MLFRSKMHQRSCRVINSFNNDLCADLEDESVDEAELHMDVETSQNNAELGNVPSLKPGVKLPKNDSEWSTANDYFKQSLDLNEPITGQDSNSKIELLNRVIYDYFATNYGFVSSHKDNEFLQKYKGFTTKQLKKTLKNFKTVQR